MGCCPTPSTRWRPPPVTTSPYRASRWRRCAGRPTCATEVRPSSSRSPPTSRSGGDLAGATVAVREVVDAGRNVDARIVDRARLGAGSALRGPAVVIGLDATVWVAPWQAGEVDDHGALRLREAGT